MKYLIVTIFICLVAGCGNSKEHIIGNRAYLRIGTSEKVVSIKAGSFELTVNSNKEWRAESRTSWISVTTTEGNGDSKIQINYEASNVAKRTGVVRLSTDGMNPVELIVVQTEQTFTNPIFDMVDPWIVKKDGYYYTCKASGSGINISRSSTLSVINGTEKIWSAPVDVAGGAIKPWNTSNIWAPELHYIDGYWYIYYAAGRPTSESNGSYDKQRAGVLRAKTDDPLGEWEDMGMIYTGDNYQPGIKPDTDNTIYAIDMGVFKFGDQLYAVWSGNASKTDGSQRLFIATMSNPYTITSSRVEISRADQSWEKNSASVNEGPAFLFNKDKSKFFVIYSCNGSWTKHYSLGYLMLNANTNPMVKSNWTKSSSAVFTRCDDTADRDGVNGVGHCSFTTSPDDTEDWIVYHVKKRNDGSWASGRVTFIQKFGWKADGTPDFGTPAGWEEALALPSGETR